MVDKELPFSLEAEQSVIGSLLIEPSAWDSIADILVATDFYRLEHQVVFRALASLSESNTPIDLIIVSERLEDEKNLTKIGGLNYLGSLVQNTPSAANVVAYAHVVHDKAILRHLIQVSRDIADSAYFPKDKNSKELVDEAESKIFQLAQDHSAKNSGPQLIADFLDPAVARLEELRAQKGAISGLSTGFADLDIKTSGLQKSDLIIVAGRPSMGKTAFALNLIENAILDKVSVVFFSLEMSVQSIVFRLFASLSRIDQSKLRSGNLSDNAAGGDWSRITSTMSMLKDAPFFIDDNQLTSMEMRARVRRVVRENGSVGLIVIDYLQLMRHPGKTDNRAEEISHISRSLKMLAKEVDAPVVVLSQLNRSLESRHERRPIMSDLRDSGAIEQDADLILFIYRDEVYNPESEDKGIAELIIGKQRNGPIGKIKLAFKSQFSRFDDLSQSYQTYDGGG